MESIILLVSVIVIAILVEYIGHLNREIKRNFETIKDLRADKIEYRDKTEYFSDELKKAKAYIKDFETIAEQYEKSKIGERLKVSTLASETNAAVSAEADFARAANQYVGDMKAPIKDYQQQTSAVFKNETEVTRTRSHEM